MNDLLDIPSTEPSLEKDMALICAAVLFEHAIRAFEAGLRTPKPCMCELCQAARRVMNELKLHQKEV